MVTTSIRPIPYHYHPLEALQRPITGPVWVFLASVNGHVVARHEGPMAECLHAQVEFLCAKTGWSDLRPAHLPRIERAAWAAWARLWFPRVTDVAWARRAREAELGRTFGIFEGMNYDDSKLRRPAAGMVRHG